MQNEQLIRSFKMINFTLRALWTIGLVIGSMLLYVIWFKTHGNTYAIANTDVTPLLGAFAILISAGIASASVMKNIAETKANEIKKHKKEDSKFYLDKCISFLEDVDKLLGKRQNDTLSWKQASEILINMRDISEYISEDAHKKIFILEYSKYSLRLYSSFANLTKEDGMPSIKSSFFTGSTMWATSDLEIAFITSKLKIKPQHIIPILEFAQAVNNNFLKSTTNYTEWRSIDLKGTDRLPMKLAIDYIEMYKDKIPEKPKDPQ